MRKVGKLAAVDLVEIVENRNLSRTGLVDG